jgi:hypothetical protein
MVVSILFTFGNNCFQSNENSSSMDALLTPCTTFKFNNNNMANEAPS